MSNITPQARMHKVFPPYADPDTRANILLSSLIGQDEITRIHVSSILGNLAIRSSYGAYSTEYEYQMGDTDWLVTVKGDSILTALGAINSPFSVQGSVPTGTEQRLLFLTGYIGAVKKSYQFASVEGINIPMESYYQIYDVRLQSLPTTSVVQTENGSQITSFYNADIVTYLVGKNGYGDCDITDSSKMGIPQDYQFEAAAEFSIFLGVITGDICSSGGVPSKNWGGMSVSEPSDEGSKTLEVDTYEDIGNLSPDQVKKFDYIYVKDEDTFYCVVDPSLLGTAGWEDGLTKSGGSGVNTSDIQETTDKQFISQQEKANISTALSLAQNAMPKSGGTFTGPVTLYADPTQDLQPATKKYVDSLSQGLDSKESVRVATTQNITLGGLPNIDGVTVSLGDRVLVKNQTDATQNGIYVVGDPWKRAPDADTSGKISPGMYCFVEEGTTNADSGFVLVTNAPITLGTTELVFTQFSGAGSITPGTGLVKRGNTLSLATTGVPAGTYSKVTVDIYGRVTQGTTLSANDLPSLPWSKIISTPTTLSGYGIVDAVKNSDVVDTATPSKILRLNSSGQLPASITGSAASANKLTTARTITLSGVTATGQTFDGSGDVTIPVTAIPADLINSGTMNAARVGQGTLSGIVVAFANDSYQTAQVRNIIQSADAPSGGSNGDVWLQYS